MTLHFTSKNSSRHCEHIGATSESCCVLKLHVLLLQVLQLATHELPQAAKHLLLPDVAFVTFFDLNSVNFSFKFRAKSFTSLPLPQCFAQILQLLCAVLVKLPIILELAQQQ
jgi:hypothetical protein